MIELVGKEMPLHSGAARKATRSTLSPARPLPWYKRNQWKALIAAFLGWAMDAMDVMLYSMVIVGVMKELGIDTRAGGLLASVTLLSSAFGGIVFGMIADRLGRVRSLMLSITIYSIGILFPVRQ